jgi:hypothetical protein
MLIPQSALNLAELPWFVEIPERALRGSGAVTSLALSPGMCHGGRIADRTALVILYSIIYIY